MGSGDNHGPRYEPATVSAVVDVVSWVLLVAGSLFCVVGGIGLLRLPDFYARMHAAGVTDTMGAGLLILGLMFQGGVSNVTVKLVLVLVFLLLTSPTAAHALVKAAYAAGVKFEQGGAGDAVRER
jgi:multicomponent Na+:H+ antiporter subunit G